MSASPHRSAESNLSRREIIAYSAAFGSSFLAAQGLHANDKTPGPVSIGSAKKPTKRYEMKKSINLWALPYPQKMTLKHCFELCKDAGFDGVEVNYALDGDLVSRGQRSADSRHWGTGPEDWD
jgi:L-ribulose-5-phosphate 3-epimerase